MCLQFILKKIHSIRTSLITIYNKMLFEFVTLLNFDTTKII